MRSCAVFDFFAVGSVTNPYKGLWGRRSLLKSYLAQKLRIPIRGYEQTQWEHKLLQNVVTNPYKGLWVRRYGVEPIRAAKLRIPIRGYEPVAVCLVITLVRVTNPYKGLWGMARLWSVAHDWVTNPYKGLWACCACLYITANISYESL